MKADIHPEYVGRHGALLLRQHLRRPARRRPDLARRALQRVPPLLHGQAEAGRHRRPHRALRAPLRQAPQVRGGRRPGRRSPSRRPTRALRRLPRPPSSRALVARPRGGDAAPTRRRSRAAPRSSTAPTGVAAARRRPDRAPLGPALVVGRPARRSTEVHLLVDGGRRRARPPGRAVRGRRRRCGRSTAPTLVAGRARPPSRRRSPPRAAPALAELLVDAGLEVVVEHGDRARRGRSASRSPASSTAPRPPACRSTSPSSRSASATPTARLTAMLHGDLPPDDALARVVEIVRAAPPGRRRAPPAEPARPRALAARHARRRPAPRRRSPTLRRGAAGRAPPEPAATRGRRRGADRRRRAVVVVCSVGVDLDLVPAAADARLAARPRRPARARRARARRPPRHPRARRRRLADARPRSSPSSGDWRSASTGGRSLLACWTGCADLEQEFAEVEARLADPAAASPTRRRYRRSPGATGSSSRSSSRGRELRAAHRGPRDRQGDAQRARRRRPRGHARRGRPRPRPTSSGSRPSCRLLLLPEGPERRARTSSSRSAAPRAARRRTSSPATCSRCTRRYAGRHGLEARGARLGPVGHGRATTRSRSCSRATACGRG